MFLSMDRGLASARLLLEGAREALEADDLARALTLLAAFEAREAELANLEPRAEVVWRMLKPIVAQRPKPVTDDELVADDLDGAAPLDGEEPDEDPAAPTPNPASLCHAVDRSLVFGLERRTLGREAAELFRRILSRPGNALDPKLHDMALRRGLAPGAGALRFLPGQSLRLPMAPGLNQLTAVDGGLLFVTRGRNAQGQYLEARLERLDQTGVLAPLALDAPIDLRPLPGGVNPMFSLARLATGKACVFPEFRSDETVGFTRLDLVSGERRPLPGLTRPAVDYPFLLCDGADRFWVCCLFAGEVLECGPDGTVLASLRPADGMCGPSFVLPLDRARRLVVCQGESVRRKYGRFLRCQKELPQRFWLWDADSGRVEPLDLDVPASPPPKYSFALGGHAVLVSDAMVHVLNPGLQSIGRLDLPEFAQSVLGMESQTREAPSYICAMEGNRLFFADKTSTLALGWLEIVLLDKEGAA